MGRAAAALGAGARRAHDESGAAITEFAFAFLMYAVVTMGAMQVSLWAFTAAAAQFAVWEGCRAGAAAYQPPPPDGRDPGGLPVQNPSAGTYAADAAFAAVDRTESILAWLPITSDFSDLSAAVEEQNMAPGEEGRREIITTVRVRPFSFLPLADTFVAQGTTGGLVLEKTCRLRLSRFYSF
ncbi:MAG: hypothetical protein ACE5EL_00235 [Anaerolineae bacterium]